MKRSVTAMSEKSTTDCIKYHGLYKVPRTVNLFVYTLMTEDEKFHLLAGAEPGAPALSTFFIVISGDFGCRDLDG